MDIHTLTFGEVSGGAGIQQRAVPAIRQSRPVPSLVHTEVPSSVR